MDFDTLLLRYFATTDLATLTPPALASGVERAEVDFGLEADRGRRFAIWTLLHMLGRAPDLDRLDPADRDTARDLMDLADRLSG